MGTERFDELDKLLHQLPLPQLNQEKSEKMFAQISEFNRDYGAKPNKQRKMSRLGISLASIAAALLLLFFTASYFGLLSGKENSHPIAGQDQTNGQPDVTHNVKAEQMQVVRQWAEGVKQRDGKKQYDQFSPELQKKYQQIFEEANWSTGTSSPWVKSYEISGGESDTYKVIFHMTSSTGDAGDLAAIVYLGKVEGDWMISKTSSSTPYLNYDLSSGDMAIDLQPQVVVTQWADGVKMRDGKQQFKMLSANLQKKYKQIFTENNWSTGTSSPWVSHVDIKKDPSQTGTFDVTFQMASSTGDAGQEKAVVHLEQVDGNWVITEITSDIQDFNLNLN